MERVYVNPDHSSQLLVQMSKLWKRDKYCDDALNFGSNKYKVCVSTAVKDKAKMLELNLQDNQHTDPLLEAAPPYQSSDLHHGMHVGSRTDNIPYTENSTGSDNFIQNNTKKSSMTTHSAQCSFDDSEEDMDIEAESYLEENSANSAKSNRCIPGCSPHLVLPNIGTSLKVLKKFLKENKLPSDIEIDTVNEESVEDFMILEETERYPYQPSSTTKVVSGQPYVYKAVAGKGSQVLLNSQFSKLPGSPRQPESEKKKTSSFNDTVFISVKSEPDTSDVEISEDTQTDLIMSMTACEDDNFSNVFVPGVSKTEDGGRVYNKELACLFCGKLLKHRLKNHLVTQHSNEKEVVALLAASKMDQKKGFQLLKNNGNFKHNIKVLDKGQGKLIVVRRSTQSSKEDGYLPCIYCMGFFRVVDLWRHCGRCPFSRKGVDEKDENARSSILAQSKMFLEGGLAKEENAVTLNFLHSSSSPLLKQMRKDEVFSIVKDDQLIMTYGEVLHKRLGSARSKDICQRMRQLARLKLAVSGSGRCKQLLDLIVDLFLIHC